MLSLPSTLFSLFLLLPLLLLHVPGCWAASEAQAVEPPPQIPDKTLAAAGVVTGTGTGGVVPPFRDGPEEGGGAEPPLPRGPLTRGGRPPLPSLVPVPADETTAKGNETKQPKPLPEFRRWPLLGDLDCGRVCSGDQPYIRERARSRVFLENESLTDWPVDCKSIRARNNFNAEPGSPAEADFPIAFARNIYKDYPYIEAELASNYAPQNWYCLAVDARANRLFKQRVRALAKCFPNVLVNDVEYRLDSMGHNQTSSLLECMKNLASGGATGEKRWRYLLVLQNHDVQMRTNEELVQIFKWMNGANDMAIRNVGFIEGFLNQTVDWTFDGLRLIKNETLSELIRHMGNAQNPKVQFAKSYYQSAVTREFVDFVLGQLDVGLMARELDRGACFIDEFLLPTLDATDALDVPGGYTHECIDRGHAAIQLTRFNVYTCNAADSAECVPNPRCRNAANARHGVCPMGMEDIAVNLRRSHSLFYNKALPEFDFGAIQCWHEEMFNRTHLDRGLHRLTPYVYTQLPQVRYQAYKQMLRNGSFASAGKKPPRFDCVYRIPVEDKLELFEADGKSGWRTFNHVRRFMNYTEVSRFTTNDVDCYGRHSTYHMRNTGGFVMSPWQKSSSSSSNNKRPPSSASPSASSSSSSSAGSSQQQQAIKKSQSPPLRHHLGHHHHHAHHNVSSVRQQDGDGGGLQQQHDQVVAPEAGEEVEDTPDFMENGESVW